MTALAVTLLFAGIFGVFGLSVAGEGDLQWQKLVRALGQLAMIAFVVGAIASQFAANYLSSVRPRR